MQERRNAAIRLAVKSQHDQSLLTSNITKPNVDNIFRTLRKEKNKHQKQCFNAASMLLYAAVMTHEM